MSVESHISEHSVRIGDYICLFNEDIHGFLYNDDSSVKNIGLKVYSRQIVDEASQIPNFHALTFQILAVNRYKQSKYYRKLLEGENVDTSTLSHAKAAADAEFKDNAADQQRLLGHPVKYGDIIQLRHVPSNKFVLMSTKESSRIDPHKMKITLQDINAKHAQFKVQPRYKVKDEGEQLETEDMIVLESVKSPSHYLHVDVQRNISEVNCATEHSVFQVFKHYTPDPKVDDKVIRGLSVVQLFHKDVEGYMSAEGIYGEGVMENAHLRLKRTVATKAYTFTPPKNTNTFWQIVAEGSSMSGDLIKWESTFHILHLTTKHYLSFTAEGDVVLVKETGDDTLFHFQPLLHETEKIYVNYEQAVRLFHIKTKGWVNSSLDLVFKRGGTGEDTSLESLEWDKAKLLQLRAGSQRAYPDVFILKSVAPEILRSFYYVEGLFPFVREIKQKADAGELGDYPGRDILSINHTFEELKSFLSSDSKEKLTRLNMLRHTKLIDSLVEILQIPYIGKRNFLLDVFRRIYEVFVEITKSRTSANLLYCGRFLTFFQTQMLMQRNVGQHCSETVIELIKDNRKVLDRIKPSSIISIVNLLIKHRHHQFFDFLGAMCVCSDVAIKENQDLIAKCYLEDNKKYIYQLQTGKDKKTSKEKAFVSNDDGETWIALAKFTSIESDVYSEDKMSFFMRQLDLYKKLCHGGNKESLKLLTRSKVLPWEVIEVALKQSKLSDEFKANLCSVFTETHLECGKLSILDNATNNYVYANGNEDAEIFEDRRNLEKEYHGLREWLMDFFMENQSFHNSKGERNNLLSQVIHLVMSLIKHGYIYEEGELHHFKRCIMNYVKQDSINRNTGKFMDKATGVLDATIQCLVFVDVIFSLQRMRRLQEILSAFKTTIKESEKSDICCGVFQDGSVVLLGPKLSSENFWKNRKIQKQITVLFRNVERNADFFGQEIVNTLFSLTDLGSDLLRRKAFHLMNKYFSLTTAVMETIQSGTLLVSTESKKINKECIATMPTLRMVANSKNAEELKSASDILQMLIGFCKPDVKEDIRSMRQKILVNNGILEVLTKLISREIDSQTENTQIENIVQKSLVLLQHLADRNVAVKEWIYTHNFDVLCGITVFPSECAHVLIEVFKDEYDIWTKVTKRQIKQLFRVCARYKEKASDWLKILKILTKDEKTGRVNARNQIDVMKTLMNMFTSVCFVMRKNHSERLDILSGQEGSQLQDYLINLIDLVAACAEGKNLFIETNCLKFVKVEELLRSINNRNIPFHKRTPFALLFLRIYLNSSKSPLEIGTDDLSHDSEMWKMIGMINDMITAPDIKKPNSGVDKGTTEEEQFLMDVGCKLLQGFLSKFYDPDTDNYPEEHDKLLEIEQNMEEFCTYFADYVTQLSDVTVMSETLQIFGTIFEPHQDDIGYKERLKQKKFVESALHKAAKRLKVKPKESQQNFNTNETFLNNKFQIYCSNIHEFVIGNNTVAFQCEMPLKHLRDKAYFPEDVPLPKGLDFQRFVKSFIAVGNEDPKVMYVRTKQAIEQLRVSSKLWPRTAPLDQEDLDLKCVQILRSMLYNNVVALPENWDDLIITERLLSRIKRIQQALDGFGIIATVMPLMGRENPAFGSQILQLLDLLLFNANISIQASVYQYFLSTNVESFFTVITEASEQAALGIKEWRNLSHSKQKTLKPKNGKLSKMLAQTVDHSEEMSVESSVNDFEMILRVLSGLCDGQNKDMQDYFRYQFDNLKSVNIIARLTQYTSLLTSGISKNTIGISINLLDTMHELCEGNQENIDTMLNYKVVDYLNHMLRKVNFSGCMLGQVITFRTKLGRLIYSMIEEHSECESSKNICETISFEHVGYVVYLCYSVAKGGAVAKDFIEGFEMDAAMEVTNTSQPETYDIGRRQKELIDNLGHLYYIILETLFDIKPKMKKTVVKRPIEVNAYEHFKKQCKSIEILKDEKLQKRHFRVHNENLLREEVKEIVKWQVDRSSPSSKLRELMFYSQDILKDIGYQKRMQRHSFLAILAKRWTIWNYACILLSFIINVLMLVTWVAPSTIADLALPDDATSFDQHNGTHCIYCKKPDIKYLTQRQYNTILFVLGSIHIMCSTILFICYIMIYHPSMPTADDIKSVFSTVKQQRRMSKLEVQFFSSTTLYHVLVVLFSVLGTVYYGYFFAFHFFGIIYNNQLLKGVIKAVTLNGSSLIWVGILGVIIIYIYSLIAFATLRDSMDLDDDEVFCRDLVECFVSMIRYGTIGDYGDKWHLHQANLDFRTFGYLTLYNVTFFIIFTTILYNIIFGIIVDTFSEIRDTKWIAEKDMKDCCYICSRNSHDFEHFAKGFNHHVKHEHNMWSYVLYFIYIDDKEEKDYTSLDRHVASMFQDIDDGFFPMNRALSLTKPVENTVEDQVDDVKMLIVDVQKTLQIQAKSLKIMREKVDNIEEQLQNQKEDDVDMQETTEYPLGESQESSRILSARADKYRQKARAAEMFRRMSILTTTLSTFSKTSAEKEVLEDLSVKTEEDGTSTILQESEDESIDGQEHENIERESDGNDSDTASQP